jgi:hypothetical protein
MERYADDMKIVYGMDFNKDGKFSKSEVLGWDANLFKVVNQWDISYEATDLNNVIIPALNVLGFDYSVAFLQAFLNDAGISGADNSPGSVAVSEPTHHVGAVFNGGTGAVNKAVFQADDSICDMMANSSEMEAKWTVVFDSMKPYIQSIFLTQPGLNQHQWTWGMSEEQEEAGINFSGVTDLHYSVGGAKLDNITFTVTVDRAGGDLEVTDLIVSGKISDLYDFDYDNLIAGNAAIVQAGYRGSGYGGHIFKNEFLLNNHVDSPSYSFA